MNQRLVFPLRLSEGKSHGVSHMRSLWGFDLRVLFDEDS